MDDLEFRKRLFADPNNLDDDMQESVASDKQRQQLHKDLLSLDSDIHNAMNVEVPEGLADKLILGQSLRAHQVKKKKTRIQFALAASVALMVGIASNMMLFSPAYSNVSDYSLAHYHHEEGKFSNVGNANYSLASVNEEMSDLNVSFAKKLGKLISVDGCFFDSMNSIHMVFEGKYDNVTVFIVPKSEHLQFTEQFSDADIKGVTRQYEQGDVIIMGDKRESLDVWQQQLDSNIEWSI
ncbi:DUF3379 family protein [Thalassotalea crassostreae]|uniref:DUF3379 family protein n=1 Tax=Thalassotalea crassostreae TaxID=1763536 RepID=UPI0008380DBE|nr:DUF3379 family protein [Thalassotalea crassostreae]